MNTTLAYIQLKPYEVWYANWCTD